MPDEVRCPACECRRNLHDSEGCESAEMSCGGCGLSPAEINAVLAMRAPKPKPVFPPPIESTGVIWGSMSERAEDAGLTGKPADGDNDLAVTDGETRAASRHPGSNTAPAGDGKKPGLVSCEGCGIVRVAAIVRDPDVCPSCGVVGRQPVVT